MNQPEKTSHLITDKFGRVHDYLRISLIERCNLRCFYCMPEEGIQLTEKANLMTHEEVIAIAKKFVLLGVKKIRLTGGEPLIKKNVEKIIHDLSQLPISLSLTTNGILLDKFRNVLMESGVKNINISLDTLNKEKFNTITRRNYFDRVIDNIISFTNDNFNIKVNAVLIKGVNDNEIIDFIEFTKDKNLSVRFIEFMPFDGNNWDNSKVVPFKEIMSKINDHFSEKKVIKLQDSINDTTKNFKIDGFKGAFGIISTVSNPFCDSCNRIRLTANGNLKNCLFSAEESDLLTALRKGDDISKIILKSVDSKKKSRGGMITDDSFFDEENYSKNRQMTTIGG